MTTKYVLRAIILLLFAVSASFAQEVTRPALGGTGVRVTAVDTNQLFITNGRKAMKLISGSNGQVLTFSGGAPTFATRSGSIYKGHVTPAGVIDSSNTRYILPDVPIDSTLILSMNGIIQYEGFAYTRAHDTLNFIIPPSPGSRLEAGYFKP